MKRQNTIILSALIFNLILITGCSQLKNCGGKCKNATISSSSDIDIFYTYFQSNQSVSIVQKTGKAKSM